MFKRLFFTAVGLGAGVAIGVYVTRQMRAAQEALKPGNIAANAATRAGGLRDRLAVALDEGRQAALAKEAELRAVHRVPEVEQDS